jgi:hypothetical protein
MKPLPNINDEAAMLERGKRSALASARNDAAEALRDACTAVQSANWNELQAVAELAVAASARLLTLSAMWTELDD